MMLGENAVLRLRGARVAVFGIGGVGGFAVEALCRSGVGTLDLIDADRVSLSNISRQIIATHKTLGEYKTEAMRSRIADIDSTTVVNTYNLFFDNNSVHLFDFSQYDYVVDAIDSVRSKVELIAAAKAAGVPIICAMGAGNKLDPTAFRVADISKTSVCPLARAVRVELKKRGITHMKVVYSEEVAKKPQLEGFAHGERAVPGSLAFVPPVAGLIAAGEAVKTLIAKVIDENADSDQEN
jgi:tRNA A37 threonylcarbamoyladenosine dehydratase